MIGQSDQLFAPTFANESMALIAKRRSLGLLIDGAAWTVSTWGHFLVAISLAWMLSREFSGVVTGIWALGLCAAVGWQATFVTRIGEVKQFSAETVERQLRNFTWSAGCVGLFWAVAAGFLFPIENVELRWFLLFIIGGMSLAAVGTQHVYLPACHASMSLALPCLAIRYAQTGAWLEALLLLLYAAVILRLAHMLHRFTMQTVRLQHDRDRLLNELVERAGQLDHAREEAELANTAKSRFLAQASHDLRQPLHAIGLFVETIAHDPDPARVERVVGRVRHSLELLSKLFESLLDVSMLDTGELQVRSEPVAVMPMFEQLGREFSGPTERGNVELRFCATRLVLDTDEALLTRLAMNLISNAIRYSPGGRVLVGMRWTPDGPAMEVRDNGVGIEKSEQRRIFKEFVRLDNVVSPAAAQGLGLGLSIVSRTSHLLDVNVTLDSEPDRGSRFQVGPFRRSSHSARRAGAEESPVMPGDLLASARVLVIDDDDQSRDGMHALLSSWRCEVTSVATPDGLEADDWDVVISDYELGDGRFGDIEVGKLQSRLPELPGILVTGSTSAEVGERAMAACLPLLRKPVRPAQLRSALLHVMVQRVP